MRKILILTALAASLVCFGQTTREEMEADLNKTGGVYYAYPVSESMNTPAPEGYAPFYISHYGRHGSRYLISTKDYTWLRDAFANAEAAGALTPLGVDVRQRLDSLLVEAMDRGGDLSPLGVRQHRGIAERMFAAYPEVFQDSVDISARSTLVVRCVLSMDAFCERLKELNPTLQITRESSQRYMPYLCYGSSESDVKKKELSHHKDEFKTRMTHPERLVASLFSNPEYVEQNVNASDLMWGLFYLASDIQDMETKIDFYDLFTPGELFDLWQVFNFDFYSGHADYIPAEGLMVANASNLLNNIIDSADEALSKNRPSATLRFGHDGNLIPLAAILRLPAASGRTDTPDEVYKVFADYKVAPMAGNIQLVFFKDTTGAGRPVLVKVMLNEQEQVLPEIEAVAGPFYDWNDVKKLYNGWRN